MIAAPDVTSTRPYLIRALYEWCTDNGCTPYVAVAVDDSVQVPREYVKDGEIVLNIGLDATSSLKLGNDFIEFKARFAGIARQIMVPVNRIMAIYARENGQGMAFPLVPAAGAKTAASSPTNLAVVPDGANVAASGVKPAQLTSVESDRRADALEDGEPEPPRPSTPGSRPALKRVK
jgi:stringent starvation protein B